MGGRLQITAVVVRSIFREFSPRHCTVAIITAYQDDWGGELLVIRRELVVMGLFVISYISLYLVSVGRNQ